MGKVASLEAVTADPLGVALPIHPGVRWSACALLAIAGVGFGILRWDHQQDEATTQVEALLGSDVPVIFNGKKITWENAYPGATNQLEDVQADCQKEIEPEAPDKNADGTMSNDVLRLQVQGQQMCITRGNGSGRLGVNVYVSRVSGVSVGDQSLSQVTLSEDSSDSDYWWDLLAGVALGGAVGIGIARL